MPAPKPPIVTSNLPRPKAKKYKALAEALYGQPWMATAEAMETLHAVLAERRSGITLSDEEIRNRIEAAGGARMPSILMDGEADSEEECSYPVVNGVAIIPVMGTLFAKANMMTKLSGATSYQELQANVTDALHRSDVRHIVIDHDSPGGQVSGCKDVADWLFAQRGGPKPIDSFVSGQCCSADMYLAAATRRIVASPSALVGSIGTLIMVRDTSGAYEQVGVKVNVLRSSPLKAAGADGEKFDGAKKQSLQYIVDSFGTMFEADIAKYRGVSADTVRERFGQGGVLTPRDAMAVGMIDSIATWDEFFRPLAQDSAPTGVRNGEVGRMKYSQQIRAALLAQGFIGAIDASDEVCAAALAGLGVSAESPTIDAVNEKIYGRMQARLAPAVTPTQIAQVLPVTPTAAAPAPSATPADDLTQIQRATQAERIRFNGLQTKRNLLAQAGAEISQAEFQAAVDSGMSVEAATSKWTELLPQKEPMVNRPRLGAQKTGYDEFRALAVPAMVQAMGREVNVSDNVAASGEYQKLIAKGPVGIMRKELELRGIETGESPAQITSTWAKASADWGGNVPLDGGLVQNAYTGTGAFPSALGGVMNTMFTGVIAVPEVTYSQWSKQLPDAPDFRPQTVFSIAGVAEFDMNNESRTAQQADLAEETGFIQVDQYDKEFVWNEWMQANDNGALASGVESLQLGHELTLERLHTNLLVSGTSATAFDGQTVFTSGTFGAQTPSARGNAITSGGGGPSSTQIAAMRKLGRGQVFNKLAGDGSSYLRMATGSISTVLISGYWEELAFQTLAKFNPETKVPVTDATINEFRGKINYIYVPNLDEQSDTKYWYAIFNRRPFIAHLFMQGYGRSGQKTVTVDTRTGVVYVTWKGRFGASFIHPQCGMVNYGS